MATARSNKTTRDEPASARPPDEGRRILIGTAGWSIPRLSAEHCPGEGTHLARYARVFGCAEINSSFHRPHARRVYEKWAAATPEAFRFAVKLPRTITHDLKLRRARAPLAQFLDESAGLGSRRGPLLVQLPPSLAFDRRVARTFFSLLTDMFDGPVVCEPRHPTWFTAGCDALLVEFRIARVAADPPTAPHADRPGGWSGLVYYRLHGSPRKYWSPYSAASIGGLAAALQSARSDAWCIFDNTASGAALGNAWELQQQVAPSL
ncbi:MAG TPA: DUF72 domain-containing protein [Vicinamibacterales bacterium]